MADDCLAISVMAGKRHLRSARTGTLSVPRTTTTLGMRSFAVAGPVIWNDLPAALRTATLSPLTFAGHLKAHLFGWSAARLRTIYDALYKSPHHHHHPCLYHHQNSRSGSETDVWTDKRSTLTKHVNRTNAGTTHHARALSHTVSWRRATHCTSTISARQCLLTSTAPAVSVKQHRLWFNTDTMSTRASRSCRARTALCVHLGAKRRYINTLPFLYAPCQLLHVRTGNRISKSTRAVQPVATCRQSSYHHKPAIATVTSFSFWRLRLRLRRSQPPFSLCRHSLLNCPRPPLRTNVRTLRTPYRV